MEYSDVCIVDWRYQQVELYEEGMI